jgi:hypothetical protein
VECKYYFPKTREMKPNHPSGALRVRVEVGLGDCRVVRSVALKEELIRIEMNGGLEEPRSRSALI